jgi:hypothetical protein
MQNIPRSRYKLDKSITKRELKNLHAAEARHRYELLTEERELQHNLAEFWDTAFDKDANRRTRLHDSLQMVTDTGQKNMSVQAAYRQVK